jgi:homopolymeric O-antigen transport system ATP-binding protein
MFDYIIKVENLGKKYKIRHQQPERYVALRDVIARTTRVIGSSALGFGRHLIGLNGTSNGNHSKPQRPTPETEDFWVLKDVSFEVKRGEVIGIIGRNGAGKSTLLKILSRITEPTEGRVSIRGRVASLLEVGTGFHPELTGRENIFVNGAILGMTREEVRSKFDEIVAFAEIEKFLDTPVKRYSSGMYVRLAFAIAAHLEPEILVVDEVLAVGDAEFQKKCLSKMKDVSNGGRTVLFVSHNIVAVKQLCKMSCWLDRGQIRAFGLVDEVCRAYLAKLFDAARNEELSDVSTTGDGRVEFLSYRVTNSKGESYPLPTTNEDIIIHILLRSREPIAQPAYGISVYNQFGTMMTCINTVEQGLTLPPLPACESTVAVRISKAPFLPGLYTASFWVMNPQCHIFAMMEHAIAFELRQSAIYGTCEVDHRWGCVYTDVKFEVASRN